MLSLFQKISSWYFTRQALPYWCVLFLDCFGVLFFGYLVYFFDNGVSSTLAEFWNILKVWGLYLIPVVTSFRYFHTYSGIIRYSSFIDLHRLGLSSLLSLVAVLLIHQFLPWELQQELYRKSAIVIVFILSLCSMWMLRVAVKFLYDEGYKDKNASRLFIYGVREGGVSIAKSVRNTPTSKYVLSGFVTNEDFKKGTWMMGVKVYAEIGRAHV